MTVLPSPKPDEIIRKKSIKADGIPAMIYFVKSGDIIINAQKYDWQGGFENHEIVFTKEEVEEVISFIRECLS